jgi:hypothetical protein
MSGMSNPSCTGWTYSPYSPYSPYTCACAAGVVMPSASTSKAPADAPLALHSEGDGRRGRDVRSWARQSDPAGSYLEGRHPMAEDGTRKRLLAIDVLLEEPEEISDGLEAELYALRDRLHMIALGGS